MFNFIKKKEGIDANTESQSCCCCETIEVEEKKEESCCGCNCGDNTPASDKTSCCGE